MAHPANETIDRICPVCNKHYPVNPTRLKHGRGLTCSKKCSYVARFASVKTKQVKSICLNCGCEIKLPASRLKNRIGAGKYCSRRCRDSHWVNANHPKFKGSPHTHKSVSTPRDEAHHSSNRNMVFGFSNHSKVSSYTDAGGAGRFFYTGKAASWERHLPGYLQPSQDLTPDERVELLAALKAEDYKPKFGTKDIFDIGQIPTWFKWKMQPARSTHPTVKPLDITSYIAGLLLPPASDRPRRLLVPFSGVGSEMIGAHLAGWDIIQGVELTPDYIPQALSRLGWWVKYPTYESAQKAYNRSKKAGRENASERTAEEKAGVRRVPLFPDEG